MVRRDVVRLLSCATDLAASDGLREPGRAPSRGDGGLTESVGKGRHGALDYCERSGTIVEGKREENKRREAQVSAFEASEDGRREGGLTLWVMWMCEVCV